MPIKLVNYFNIKTYSHAGQQVILSYLLKGVSVIISLFYVPAMLKYLTKEQFGIWVAISSIVAWVRLFNFGVGDGLRFYLSAAIASGDSEKAKKLISTTYFTVCVIFFIVWIAFVLVNPTINWSSLLNSKLIAQTQYTRIMFYAVTCFIINFVLDIIRTIYEANRQTSTGNVLQISSSLLTLVGIEILSHFTGSNQLELAVLVVVISPIIVNIIATIITFSYIFPLLRPSWRSIKINSSKELFNLSIKFFLLQTTATIIYASIPFVIARLYGPSSVTSYHVASSIFNLPILIIGLFTTPLIPFVTQEYSSLNFGWVQNSLKKSMLIAFGVVFVTIVLILFSPLIYKFWLGDNIEIPFKLTVSIGCYAILRVLINPLSTFMNAIGKIDSFLKFTPLEIFLYIGGICFFDSIIGNVISVILALILTSFVGLILQPLILKKHLKLNKMFIFTGWRNL